MRTIQEVGLEVLNGNPQQFYIFLGREYAIKRKYIEILHKHYGRCKEVDTFEDMKCIVRGSTLFPVLPTLYIIRYDDMFVKRLTDNAKIEFEYLNLIGTLIFIYESDSDCKKLDKYLPDYTVTFFSVNDNLQKKYLTKDYPNIPDNVIDDVIGLNHGYTISDNICKSLCCYPHLSRLTKHDIIGMFESHQDNIISKLQYCFANRNCVGIYKLLEMDDIDISNLHYKFLSVIIELMKVRKSSYVDSPYKDFASKWSNDDLRNMFNFIYSELIKLRTISSDTYNSIMLIATLLCYKNIPSRL